VDDGDFDYDDEYEAHHDLINRVRQPKRRQDVLGFSINKIMLVGRLGADPEFKVLPNGTALLKMRVAVDDNMSKEDKTDWFNVNIWAKFAEAIKDKVSKGDVVSITGRMTSRQYESKEGAKVTSWEVQADECVIHQRGERRDTDRAPRDELGNDIDPYAIPGKNGGAQQRRRF
jgi:single-strand DNA-binding protein